MASASTPPDPSRLVPLVKQAKTIIMSSLSKASRANYNKVLVDYKKFVSQTLLVSNAIPINIGHLILYLTHLHKLGYASATIISRLSALNYCQLTVQAPNLNSHFLIQKFTSGLSKLHSSVDLRSPITPDILRSLLSALPQTVTGPYYIKMYRAMMVLSFFAFIRPGEITDSPNNLQFHQIALNKSQVSITFIKFKHHKGPPVTITIKSQTNSHCPVALARDYILARGIAPGPLFCHQNGLPISYNQFNVALYNTQALIQSKQKLNLHGFRIGAATYAASQGCSELNIRRMGRWSSNAVQKYIRISSFNIN